jgi:hypothetical protein
MTASFHILSNNLFINNLIFRRYSI